MHTIPFPEEDAQNLVSTVVRQTAALWKEYPQFSREDAFQVAFYGCFKQWKNYDPDRGAPSNFIIRVARSRILDLLRTAKSRRSWTERAMADSAVRESAPVEPSVRQACGDGLADQLGNVYRRVHQTTRKLRKERGRPFVDPARTIALAWLRKRLNLSVRGGFILLRDRPELRKAVQLTTASTRYAFENLDEKCLIIRRRLGIPAET